MRFTFIIFLFLSLIIHLIFIGQVDLSAPEKENQRPIDVSVIKKKKPVPPKIEEPQEQAQSQKPPVDIREEDIPPLDEEIETDVNQLEAVPSERSHDESLERKDDKAGETPVPTEPDDSELQAVEDDEPPVELPKVQAQKKLSKDQIKDILNPKDVIDKYAREGGTPAGEDYVSMQYVRLKYQSYFYKFSRRLYQVWIYPKHAAFRGEQGTVRISFTIARNGMISGINVIESSGYPDLDKEAVIALRKTAGVPLPKSYELNFLKVDAYFKYILNNNSFVIY